MEKMSLHESLRIYVPGLLLCLILFLLFSGTVKDSGFVAIPAIFVGFAINAPLHKITTAYFGFLIEKYQITLNRETKPFKLHENAILTAKINLYRESIANTDGYLISNVEGWNFIGYAHFAKIYDSAETSSFRLPKTLGVMCFNLFLVSLIGPIVSLIILKLAHLPLEVWHTSIILASLTLSILFFITATQFLKSALLKQLYYWASLSNQEIENLIHLFQVKEKI
jgi:hypothetical protein